MKTSSFQRDKTKYRKFHRDHRHDIDDCRILKDEIEFVIRRRHFKQYTRPEHDAQPYEEHWATKDNKPGNPEQVE